MVRKSVKKTKAKAEPSSTRTVSKKGLPAPSSEQNVSAEKEFAARKSAKKGVKRA